MEWGLKLLMTEKYFSKIIALHVPAYRFIKGVWQAREMPKICVFQGYVTIKIHLTGIWPNVVPEGHTV